MNIANSFVVRRMQKNDFDDWEQLWSGYLEFYTSTVESRVYTTTFDRLTSDANCSQNALVAEQGGSLVGLVHYIFHPHNWKIEDVCYLQDLCVLDTLRGQGIGRLLIEAVYDEADKRGVPTVYWLTQDFNKAARLLYDKVATLTPFIKYNR